MRAENGPAGSTCKSGGLDDDEHVLVLERDVERLGRVGLAPGRAMELELVAGASGLLARRTRDR